MKVKGVQFEELTAVWKKSLPIARCVTLVSSAALIQSFNQPTSMDKEGSKTNIVLRTLKNKENSFQFKVIGFINVVYEIQTINRRN